jgi:hypothetical protein
MFTAYIQSGGTAEAQEHSALQTSSDEALIARIAEGDKLAMQVLFAPSHPGLSLAFALCRQ